MTPRRIVVVGSLNIDLVVRTARLPRPGETVRGRDFETIPGGKGANQAVAAARLAGDGIEVAMVGRVGTDDFGGVLLASLREAGVVTDAVERVAGPTGNAMIAVEESGENFIIITAGANGRIEPGELDRVAPLLRGADALLLQLEVPMPVVTRAAELAAEGGARVLLNPAPAPAGPLPDELLRHVTHLIPNQSEAVALSGATEPGAATHVLRALGVGTVIMTLGAEGARVSDGAGSETIPAFEIEPVDTTAAGDAFVGALAVALVEGRPAREAARWAAAAGALAATRPGAQPSLPTRDELEAFVARRGAG